jgi:O-antigen ligase
MKKVLNLENLIYLTILALPSYLLRFSLFGFSTNALDCLLLVCIVWGLIFYFEKRELSSFFGKNKLAIFLVGLIFFGLVVSIFLNRNYAIGLGIVKSWFVLPILFSLLVGRVIDRDKLKNIFFAYHASAFLVAMISLGCYFFGDMTYDFRLQGFFNSPNYLAMYLAPAVFIGYSPFPTVTDKKKWLVLASVGFIFWALYLTQSYASWISVALAFSLVLVIEKKLNWKKSLAGLVLLLLVFFSQLEKNKFSDLIDFSSRSSLASRIMIWQSAGKMLKTDWIWGIGAGNFQAKYLENQKYFPPYLEWAVPHPHNLYLAFWLYGGVFSLIGFLALVYCWFSRFFQTQKNPQLKLIGLGIMVYILLHGLVDTTYFKNDLAVVFWLLFMLI